MRPAFTLHDCLVILDQSPLHCRLTRRSVLESAIAAPFQTFGGQDLYPSLVQKAARLGYGIAEAQAFDDGNKRIAFYSMMVFLKRNGLDLVASQEATAAQFVCLATKEIDLEQFTAWLGAHCRPRY